MIIAKRKSDNSATTKQERAVSGPTAGLPESGTNERERILQEALNEVVKSIQEKQQSLAENKLVEASEFLARLAEQLGLEPQAESHKTADRLVALVENVEISLFHDSADEAFATVPVANHRETWKLRSRQFKRWLRHQWHRKYKSALPDKALEETLSVLEARAIYDGSLENVHIRIAHADNKIFIDLCDKDWRVIEVSASGWEITTESPVYFTRTPGMLPLPTPVKGGSAIEKLGKLRPLLNVTDISWRRIVAWLLAVFSEGPYFVLVLTGEQGTAKSFAIRLLRKCIDPTKFEVLTAPRESRDVIIAAVNQHVLAIDNLSGVPEWLSDLLCGIATGTASRQRAYHTNDGTEVMFEAKKPVIVGGIDLVLRDDLADRTLPAELLKIEKQHRKAEKKLLTEFECVKRDVLGGILDLLVETLKNLPTTEALPVRMADAGAWITAAEDALGWGKGDFLKLYEQSRDETTEDSITSDIFAARLSEFMQDKDIWIGTQKRLNEMLLEEKEKQRLPVGWPNTGKALVGKLKRFAPALRHAGLLYEYNHTARPRTYTFTKTGVTSGESDGSDETTLAEASSPTFTQKLADSRSVTSVDSEDTNVPNDTSNTLKNASDVQSEGLKPLINGPSPLRTLPTHAATCLEQDSLQLALSEGIII